MASNKMTFIKLLDEYTIEIPRIQRDYVQGRAITIEQVERRKDFVNNLVDAMNGGRPCVLDFVYGFISGEGNVRTFIPLDGQQRLTSLYLLHWYLLHLIAEKEDDSESQNKFVVDDKMKILNGKFKYNNRISSTEFCLRLTSKDEFIEIEGENEIRKVIMQQPWFDEEWIFDPTIETMLDMLQVYESFLKEKDYEELTGMAENLFNQECIYFDKLSLEDLHQGESLYVKMNARGKKLTHFENWKAKFTKMLEDYHKDEEFQQGDEKRCNSKKYKDYFCYSIEHEWNDLFWHFVTKHIQWNSIDEVMNQAYPTVDRAFSNFLRFIHQILYFYDRNDEKAKIGDFQWTFAQNEETYGNGKGTNLEFLFQCLDFLAHIDSDYTTNNNKGLDAFFDDIFYSKQKNLDQGEGHKVRIKNDDKNLFEKAIRYEKDEKKNVIINNLDESSRFSLEEMYLLWAILKYCAPKFCLNRKDFKADDSLRLYVRECRNKLDAVDQFLTSTVVLSPNLKLIDANSTIKKFPGQKFERYKNTTVQELYEWLDDFDYLYEGNSNSNHAYIPILDNIQSGTSTITIPQVKNFVNAFEKCSTLVRIQLLIGAGYKGKSAIGSTGGDRERIFFGQKNRWNVLFIEDAATLTPILEKLIKDYSSFNDIQKQIDSYKKNAMINTFAYYMLNYDYALWGANDCTTLWSAEDGFAFFAVSGNLDEMDLISLRSISSQPLSAYHIDPLACTVVNACIATCPQLMQHIRVSGRFSTKSGIAIPNTQNDTDDFELISNKDGWTIRTDNVNLSKVILSKNNNIKYNNYIFELYNNNIKEIDKVKIGIAILKEIIKIEHW